MLVKIGSYNICDGTLSGGVAISELRAAVDRLYDFAIPVGEDDSIFFDRVNSRLDFTFTVKRTFPDKATAEKFITQLDTVLPTSGTITLTTTGPSPVTRTIPNGAVTEHALLLETGATTFHQYHIIGGAPVT